MRLHFPNLLHLAQGGRTLRKAIAVGSIPPELRHVCYQLESLGVEVKLLERGTLSAGEQGVDQTLLVEMLQDALDYNGDPGIVSLLTGDSERIRALGAGFVCAMVAVGEGGCPPT